MGDRKSRPKVLDELRERLVEVVGIQQADDIMEVLADYDIRRRGVDLNMVISQPVQQPQGFSRWHLEEAYAEGLRRGRTGG